MTDNIETESDSQSIQTTEIDRAERLQAVPSSEERPNWGEFHGGDVDVDGEYHPPTPEQKARFNNNIERVSEIFENADFEWLLDGATNISLLRGEQIRDHKDLDMSVFREDLGKLDNLLAQQGFGIFVNYEENGKKIMRKITAEELVSAGVLDLSICKIDSYGKIQRETQEPFNFVDLHVHSKDENGDTVISYNGATLPKEYFEPNKKVLQNGKTINLSQPALVAYHKLFSNRPRDLMDLQKLRPTLQQKDFLMLRDSLKREVENSEKTFGVKIQEAWTSLAPLLKLNHDQKLISEKLWEHPDLQKLRDDQKISEFVSQISQYVAENPNLDYNDFFQRSLAILNPREQIDQKLEILDQLEKI